MTKPSRIMRALDQWMLQRRERSFKNRKTANTFMCKRPELIMKDIPSASTMLLPEESSYSNRKLAQCGVNCLDDHVDDNLLPTETERTENNAENENLAANEGINCREIEDIEKFLTVPDEEVNNDDFTIYEGLSPIISDAEYKEMCDLLFIRDDFSCNNMGNTGLVFDKENGGLVGVIEDTERESMMEQNGGRQTKKNDENIEKNTEIYEEKATPSKNGTKKRKKNRKTGARKISSSEKKAQVLLMKMLQEKCGGEYHVRVSREDLRERAKSKKYTDRITDRGVLDTVLKSTVGMVMNEKGDKFMRGYKEYTREMEYWIEGPNGEGSTSWIFQDYVNIKEQNIKLKEDNLMIKKENEMLKEELEMIQKMQNEEEKLQKMEKTNQDLENQLRECKRMIARLNHFESELANHYRR